MPRDIVKYSYDTELEKIAAKEAYQMAGLQPSDIDVVELHDCFTIAEIVDSEEGDA